MRRVFKDQLPPFVAAYRKGPSSYLLQAKYITPSGANRAGIWYFAFCVPTALYLCSQEWASTPPGALLALFLSLAALIPGAAVANSRFMRLAHSKTVQVLFTPQGLSWGRNAFGMWRHHVPSSVQWRPRTIEDAETNAKQRKENSHEMAALVIIESGSHWQKRAILFEAFGYDAMSLCEQTVTAINFMAAQVGNEGRSRPARRPRREA